MSNGDIDIGIRAMTDEDRGYVTNTWLDNYKKHSDWSVPLDTEVYWRSHRQIVHRLIEDHETIVAYDPADPRVLLGFLCGDNYPSAAVVHYAYVREKLRRWGIGMAMLCHLGWLPSSPVMASHWTTDARKVARVRPVVYNPYYAFQDFQGVLSGKTTYKHNEDGAVVQLHTKRRGSRAR